MKKISGLSFILFLCAMCPFVAWAEDGPNDFVRSMRSLIGDGSGYCWFCTIFDTLFDAMNTIATTISRDLSQTFLALMGVGLLFSIGLKTARMLTSLQAVDLMQYLTDMFRHLGRAIIASAFLWASLSIFTYVISPFLTMSLSLSTTIAEIGDIRASVTKATQEINKHSDARIKVSDICRTDEDNVFPLITAEAAALDRGEVPQKAFSPSVKAALNCMMKSVSASLISGMAVGGALFFGGFDVISNQFTQIGTAFEMIIIGFIIIVGYLLIYLAVPFRYVDAMVRMAFVCALMPLWVILWVFQITSGYTKKAWDIFLSTCAIFVCMSIILILVIQLINAAFGEDVLETVVIYLVAGQAKEAAEVFNVSLKNLLVVVIMCFIGYKMLGTATTLASSFIGSPPHLGVGEQAARTSVAVGVAAGGAGVAGAVLAGRGAKAAGRKAKAGLNKLGAKYGNPKLGDQTAESTGRIAKHTAAALLTSGFSLPVSFGMAMYDLLKGKKKAPPAPERPVFGKGGSTMGIQAYDMSLISEGKDANQDIVKTYKDAVGNTVTQIYDKNNPKNLKNELFEDAKGRQLEKKYKDGQLQSEQTKYSDKATQKTKDADKESGAFKEETKEYEYSTEGGKEIETVTTKDAKDNIVETQKTTTEKDEKGNFKHQECVVKDAEGNLLRFKDTRFDEQGREKHIDEVDNKDNKSITTEIEYKDGKIVETRTDHKNGGAVSTNVITFESNTNGEKTKTSKLYEGNDTSDKGKLLEETKEISKNERVKEIEKKDHKNKKSTVIKYIENSQRVEQDYAIDAEGKRGDKIGSERHYQNEILVREVTE